MDSRVTDVAIVGAGPYGLSLAAHLKHKGLDFRIFGRPMQTWRAMPQGMHLKSFGFATNVYDPSGEHTFVRYCNDRNLESFEPCSMADFARYGVWVQETLLPELHQADVVHLGHDGQRYSMTLSDGSRISARHVVIAVGLTYFARIPDPLAALPNQFASHTADHSDYSHFKDKDVCVVGAGQSAFEAARLLLDAGARPRLLIREPSFSFSEKMPLKRSLWECLRRPQSGLGPGLKSFLLERVPILMHFMPDYWRLPFTRHFLGPQGAWWLKDRIVGKIPIITNCALVGAEPNGQRLRLQLRTGGISQELDCDHVIAGTGFVADVDRLSFIDPHLRKRIRRTESAPTLDYRFQSSQKGLYFIGFASSPCFGPLFRFVAGARFTSYWLARTLSQQLSSSHVESFPYLLPESGAQK
ncbi:NAD(P)-binding domain-containing protein [Hyphomicrobium sp.]|jgi:lysine/ornithine N-monooxygenase|uniref:NAD(P)-binding domain-containing protein n=1 Tax=Hyphomicrobium sp. TaxID=82 RepID=UPI002C111D0D|nr:NAD(P)-binding domain-containing protein [Hyphomicrobium sp.]HVZ05404.1 NAD(P)-binding domain-containing protein [Hyphomicrobium sp.]